MRDKLRIPIVQWLGGKTTVEQTRDVARADKSCGTNQSEVIVVPAVVVKAMASIATNAWKAKSKMVDAKSGEALEEMKRVYRHIEAILESFQEMGLEIKDHTDDAFDYGLPLKVVTTQPTPGITKERVIETIKPTIYWQNRIIQMGEVVIATPA
jgi:hypothetical protein